MSRSYKRNPYYSADAGKLKEWKQRLNRRRRSASKKILALREWDSFLLPVYKDAKDRWVYPKDEGRRRILRTPLLNECEITHQDISLHHPSLLKWVHYSIDNYGHYKNCNCYTNKSSKYWKMLRK